ncbi:MAG TPA: patatin-like phospholipase family protein [Candidatus Cloacimonadota bacterium]|nr:patatin-like phospholipase family protein [Candidatus Cloacimonadota bacterium]HPS39885.1 patatin-like phospholipase family protein [Candidatus Cloacimonadota bacterium]
MKKKAKLILGGGSAYGLAHIGVIAALEEQFEITGIVGTSMGAIVGAMYCLGKTPAEILDIAQEYRTVELFNPLSLDISLSGIFDGKTTLKRFLKWTLSKDISQGVIPFVAVAYDLLKSKTILIDKGRYAEAMRASSSLPYIFAPFAYDHYLFVDGGIEHPLPLAFHDKVPGEVTIAVNVLPPVSVDVESIEIRHSKARIRMRSHQVFLQSIMQNQGFVAIQAMLYHKPDIYIDAYNPKLGLIDINRAQQFYDFGFNAAELALEQHREPGFVEALQQKYQNLLARIRPNWK